MAININIYHHYPETERMLTEISKKLDQILKHQGDQAKLGQLADKLDTSTNTLKETVDRNQPSGSVQQ